MMLAEDRVSIQDEVGGGTSVGKRGGESTTTVSKDVLLHHARG